MAWKTYTDSEGNKLEYNTRVVYEIPLTQLRGIEGSDQVDIKRMVA